MGVTTPSLSKILLATTTSIAFACQLWGAVLILSGHQVWRMIPKYHPLNNRAVEDDDDVDADQTGDEVHGFEHNVYLDKDGESTQQSMADARDIPQRIILTLSSTAIIALALLSAIRPNALVQSFDIVPKAVILALSVSIAIQSFVIASSSSPRFRYRLGLCVSVSSLLLLIGVYSQLLDVIEDPGLDRSNRLILALYTMLNAVNIVAALSFHQRPAVYRNGRSVDGQLSTTALSRMSFHWISGLIKAAHSKTSLDETDLPLLDATLRSKGLKKHLEKRPKFPQQSLWLLIIKEHWVIIAQQWSLAVVTAVFQLAPEFALFNLLAAMEQRDASVGLGDSSVVIGLWAFALGLSSLLHNVFAQWLDWIKWSCLELRVRAQLTSVVFSKALRLQDIRAATEESADGKNTHNESQAIHQDSQPSLESDETTPLLQNKLRRKFSTASRSDATIFKNDERESSNDGDSDESNDDDETDSAPGTKSIIQLIDVDTSRVSYNITELDEFLSNILVLAIGLGFLVSILGWLSTLAGISIPLIFAPITKFITSYLTKVSNRASKATDRKSNVVSESLHGIRQIKFATLESHWKQIIMAARENELSILRHLVWLYVALAVIFTTMPIFLGATALIVYALTHGTLSASVAFTALSVFASLESSLSYLPIMIANIADTHVSLKRIRTFLNQGERDEYIQDGNTIALQDASFCWPTQNPKSEVEDRFTLTHLNLNFPANSTSVIMGKTGAGKSLLLAGIVGEASLTAGQVFAPQIPRGHNIWHPSHLIESNWLLPAAKAFVSQVPWIENASVRDNILYGLPYMPERYQRVIHACALGQDLLVLQDGDETEIGASGVNISGGQKWRLTLARALYSRAGILVLDDIFSAVDSHVGRHILDHVILGDLSRERTIIIATHHSDLVLPVAGLVVEIESGGTIKTTYPERSFKPLVSKQQDLLTVPTAKTNDSDAAGTRTPRKFVEDERRAEGRVTASVYWAYYQATGGLPFWILALFVFTISAATMLGRSYWIKHFTESEASSVSGSRLVEQDGNLRNFIVGYATLSLASALLTAVKMSLIRLEMLRAGRKLFEQLTTTVLKAKLHWIDRVPIGRALNRFIGDFDNVDQMLAVWIAYSASEAFSLLAILVGALVVSPLTLVIIVPLLLGVGLVTWRYLPPARDLKRIHSVSKSPILDTVGVVLSGLPTIRTFEKADIYMSRMCELIDTSTRAEYHLHLMSVWMESRQGLLSSLFEITLAVYVALDGRFSAASAGFALSLAVDFSWNMIELVQDLTRLELSMNSVERIVEYTNIPTESEDGKDVAAAWPTEGRVEVSNLSITYADDLPPALKGVSFSINPRERVGIVGRTGSGKSSLTLALFRFLDPLDGSIAIDGIDISTVRLQDLRSRLSIIPQDPVLFSGTVRSNIDPQNQYTDTQVFAALRQVNLLDSTDTQDTRAVQGNDIAVIDSSDMQAHNANVFADLSSRIAKGGSNISHGQRQLMCLARALLGAPRIILLDEATSAVDMDTDARIQASIRSGFAASTLIVVAHRLSTVIDFDKVLVMGDGRVLEYGAPLDVFRRGGEFATMVLQSGEKQKLISAMEAKASQ